MSPKKSLKDVTVPMKELFPDAYPFYGGLKRAVEFRLQWEYIQSFIEDLKTNGNTEQAVFHACREWDL